MPYAYSPTYYDDQKKQHDFYINLGNQCRLAEEHRQAIRKAQMELQEQERYYLKLQEYNKKLNEAKSTLETNRKLKHALFEYNYTKDKELVILPDRIAWKDCLPFLPDSIKED
jgi:methionyl-tRNA synthetase